MVSCAYTQRTNKHVWRAASSMHAHPSDTPIHLSRRSSRCRQSTSRYCHDSQPSSQHSLRRSKKKALQKNKARHRLTKTVWQAVQSTRHPRATRHAGYDEYMGMHGPSSFEHGGEHFQTEDHGISRHRNGSVRRGRGMLQETVIDVRRISNCLTWIMRPVF